MYTPFERLPTPCPEKDGGPMQRHWFAWDTPAVGLILVNECYKHRTPVSWSFLPVMGRFCTSYPGLDVANGHVNKISMILKHPGINRYKYASSSSSLNNAAGASIPGGPKTSRNVRNYNGAYTSCGEISFGTFVDQYVLLFTYKFQWPH